MFLQTEQSSVPLAPRSRIELIQQNQFYGCRRFCRASLSGSYQIALRASFGFAVMGRVSLLIGRFEDLINYSSSQYNYATPVILLFMIILLGIWSFQSRKTEQN